LVTAALLSGLLGSSHQSTVPQSVKDRSPPYRPGRLGHFRSPKHNSIAKYYQEVRRPTVRECVDPELPQRVRDAAAIFTGTVRDLVKDDARAGQTAIVEIKRVIKGDAVVDRFTSSPADVYHAASHHRRRRRMVAVTGLGDGRICRNRTRLYDTWIFFTVVVSDPSSRLRLNSSLARMSLANILQVEAALKGSMLANV